MSRRKDKDQSPAKSEKKAEKPPPERRPKTSRNPLRRHSTARDMQAIPSPNASMTELADTSSGQPPRTPDVSESHPLSRSVSADPQPAQTAVNGDIAQRSSNEQSAMTNGTAAPGTAIEDRKTRPPSTIFEEVRQTRACRSFVCLQSPGRNRFCCR